MKRLSIDEFITAANEPFFREYAFTACVPKPKTGLLITNKVMGRKGDLVWVLK